MLQTSAGAVFRDHAKPSERVKLRSIQRLLRKFRIIYIYIFRFIQELKGPLKRLHPLPLSLCQAPSFSFSLWGATSFRLTHSSYRATHSGYGATPVLCQGGNLYVDW